MRGVYLMISMVSMLSLGCSEMSQERIEIPLSVEGVDLSSPIRARDDVDVTLERAQLAFGPLYLCAGSTAGDLCETARLEWLGSAVIDLGSPEPREVGLLKGVTGEVRSWMYDLGISSQLTRSDPFTLDAARELDGASISLEGYAEVDGISVPFMISLEASQTDDTELGVPLVRKSSSDRFMHDVTRDDRRLTVRFDARAWVQRLNFRPYVRRDECTDELNATMSATVDGRTVICDGTTELTCEDQQTYTTRDCSALEQVCLPGVGCADRLEIESDSELYRALRNTLVSGERPTFRWSQSP